MAQILETLRSLMAQGRHSEAERSIDELVINSPSWIEANRILAFKYFEVRMLDEALVALRRVLEGSPNLPWALQLDARLARARGDTATQLKSLERLNTLLPNDPVVTAAYEELLAAEGKHSLASQVRETFEKWRHAEIDQLPAWQDERAPPRSRYLDLLERTICNVIYGDATISGHMTGEYVEERRLVGRDLPSQAHSMIGLRRLHQLRRAAETVLDEGVPGDFIETGVWRGGACILMSGVLAEREVTDRKVIVADSFAGLPPPDPRHAQDALTTFDFHKRPELAVSADVVRANFQRYELLSEQVVFLEGFFSESLPTLPDRPIALLRLDGDLYSSTMDALDILYDRVSPGGYVIVDDYGAIIDCRRAILDFRARRAITSPMIAVDGDAVFWRKAVD